MVGEGTVGLCALSTETAGLAGCAYLLANSVVNAVTATGSMLINLISLSGVFPEVCLQNSCTVSNSTCAHSATGTPNVPELIAGMAIDVKFRLAARCSDFLTADASNATTWSCGKSFHLGPTA